MSQLLSWFLGRTQPAEEDSTPLSEAVEETPTPPKKRKRRSVQPQGVRLSNLVEPTMKSCVELIAAGFRSTAFIEGHQTHYKTPSARLEAQKDLLESIFPISFGKNKGTHRLACTLAYTFPFWRDSKLYIIPEDSSAELSIVSVAVKVPLFVTNNSRAKLKFGSRKEESIWIAAFISRFLDKPINYEADFYFRIAPPLTEAKVEQVT